MLKIQRWLRSNESAEEFVSIGNNLEHQNQFKSIRENFLFGGSEMNLCGLLMRFRMHNIVLLSDIEKAFLQIGLQESERDVTRFLWLKDISNPSLTGNVQILRFCRVPFGVVSSPFLLGATVDYHLKQQKSELAEGMPNNVYVDYVLAGAKDLDQAAEIYKEAKTLFAAASMNLRKWTSNSSVFLESIPEYGRVSPGITKVLGLKWDTQKDTLPIQKADQESQAGVKTKRDVLKVLAQYFDPLGFYLPITIRGKLFLKILWNDGLRWDDQLSPDQRKTWDALCVDLKEISSRSLPRSLIYSEQDAQLYLLCFEDASKDVYAATVYLHIRTPQESKTSFVFAKSRLRPNKPITVPRLELMAMLIGVRCLKFTEKELRMEIKAKILWSDSQCALHWLRSTKPLPVFASNRVKKIREAQGVQYRYIHTSENPADCVTRGTTPKELLNLWWGGPEWLHLSPDKWLEWNMSKITEEQLKTADKVDKGQPSIHEATLVSGTKHAVSPFEIEESKFSSLMKLLRVTAWAKQFIAMCSKKVHVKGSLSSNELAAAKTDWELYAQQRYFPEICKAAKKGDRNIQMIKQLGLQLGSDRVMRCYGRTSLADISNDTKFPKLLPKEGTFSKLVIEEFHKRLCHAGVTHTLSQICHEYWIPQGRATVRKILKGCLMCRRVDSGPFQLPSMPDLPASRVNPSPPFTHTGLDYFGPMFVKTENGQKKVWACIFTRLTVRAIHLELVEDMSADQFLLCLRRFMARRGKPSVIHCDNAPQFKVAMSAMDILWKQVISAERVQSHLSTSGTLWKFITEMAPWMGGHYERLIGVVKRLIKRSIGQKALTTVEITTLFAEIEASD